MVRLPNGEKWDVLRPVIDGVIFPGYHDKIRFAALTLNGRGLSGYGPCALILREDRIARRTTVFEENSILLDGTPRIAI